MTAGSTHARTVWLILTLIRQNSSEGQWKGAQSNSTWRTIMYQHNLIIKFNKQGQRKVSIKASLEMSHPESKIGSRNINKHFQKTKQKKMTPKTTLRHLIRYSTSAKRKTLQKFKQKSIIKLNFTNSLSITISPLHQIQKNSYRNLALFNRVMSKSTLL